MVEELGRIGGDDACMGSWQIVIFDQFGSLGVWGRRIRDWTMDARVSYRLFVPDR